jgi:hypothetical protein
MLQQLSRSLVPALFYGFNDLAIVPIADTRTQKADQFIDIVAGE